MRCPRCTTVNGDGATRCAGCGLPIALGEEPPPRPVDTVLSLDRRVSRRGGEPPPVPPAAPVSPEGPAPQEGPVAREEPVQGESPGAPWEMAPPDGVAFEDEPAVPVVEAEPIPTLSIEVLLAPAAPGPVEADGVAPGPAPDPFPVAPVAVETPAPVAREAAVPVHRTRAPAWRRALSWLVDAALLGALVALLLLPVTGPVAGAEAAALLRSLALPAVLLVALLAFAWQWLGVALAGGTPGLLAAGLRVVGPDGHRPAPGRAAVRAALGLPAAGLLGAGLLLALFTRSGRGAHDLGAGTWVVLPPRGGRR